MKGASRGHTSVRAPQDAEAMHALGSTVNTVFTVEPVDALGRFPDHPVHLPPTPEAGEGLWEPPQDFLGPKNGGSWIVTPQSQ